MPIEVNRVNKECPRCKNPQIFDTGKNYFCGKCLIEIPKTKVTVSEPVMVEVKGTIPVAMISNEPEITEDEKKEVEQ